MNDCFARHLQGLSLGSREYFIVDVHCRPTAKDDIDGIDFVAGENTLQIRHRTRYQAGPAPLRHVFGTPSDGVLIELDAVKGDTAVGPPKRLKVGTYVGTKFQHRVRIEGNAFAREPIS